jgi:glucokinase
VAPCLLVGDIGGTNARFAVADAEKPAFSDDLTFDCSEFASADLAIDAYLAEIKAPRPSIVCIAAAGPVVDGNIQLTNSNWSIGTTGLESKFPGAGIFLLNDFDAVAYSIPLLGEADCVAVGKVQAIDLDKESFTIGVIGPGTGLGTAGLCRRNGQSFAIGGEGGHVGFAPTTRLQIDLLAELTQEFDRVPVERLVSGPGAVNIHRALASIRGQANTQTGAADIFALASEGKEDLAIEAVQVFFEVLGQVAGDLALSLGAVDGMYIGGGIVKRYPELLASSRFRASFEMKGPYRSMMENIPTQLIMHPQPGLLGASYCAMQMLHGDM